MTGEFITLARVVKTQGRLGEVGCEVLSDAPGRFSVGMKFWALPLQDDQGRRELQIEEIWPHKGLLVFKFAGVDSISQAEELIGCELQIPLSERAKLEPGWTYISELVGCDVLDDGRRIGKIERVEVGAGEAPLLIVRSGDKLFDVPFAEAYLQGVDLEKRQVRMSLPDGLLEVNEPMTAEEKEEQGRPRRKH